MTDSAYASDRALITIIGAGFTGTSIAIQQIDAYLSARETDAELPPLTVRLIDKSGGAGPGLPYATSDDVFLLNQPAWAMSPFPDAPDHFTDWRAAHGYGDDPNAFERRSVYGRYLKDIFAAAVARAEKSGADIAVETVKGTVTGLAFRTGGAIALDGAGQSGAAQESDAVIIADGHQKNSLLAGLRGDEFYFEPPFSAAAIREKLRDKTGTVVIVGTSQSMLDALAVLDHIGWAGSVRAISHDLILPWPFHPERYGENSTVAPYAPAVLTADNIAAAADPLELLQRELDEATARGYDVGHVVTCPQIYAAIAAAEPHAACAVLRERLAKIYSNPTPPERYALFRRWLDSGRLELAAADARDITPAGDDTYSLGGERLTAVFNGACFTRDALASPLLRQAHEAGALRWNEQTSQPAAGAQAHPGLYVCGPAAHRDKWGVETFRDECHDAARGSLSHALARHRQPVPVFS